MDHFAGLDVSVKETSVCIVDDTCKSARGLNADRRGNLLKFLLLVGSKFGAYLHCCRLFRLAVP